MIMYKLMLLPQPLLAPTTITTKIVILIWLSPTWHVYFSVAAIQLSEDEEKLDSSICICKSLSLGYSIIFLVTPHKKNDSTWMTLDTMKRMIDVVTNTDVKYQKHSFPHSVDPL